MNANEQYLLEDQKIGDSLDGFEPKGSEVKKVWALAQRMGKRKMGEMTIKQFHTYMIGLARADQNMFAGILDLSRQMNDFFNSKTHTVDLPFSKKRDLDYKKTKTSDTNLDAVAAAKTRAEKLLKKTNEGVMQFPHLQMLAEAKKKKAPVDDMEMDFSSEEALEAPAEDKAEPVAMGKKEILAALKECSPKDRKAIHAKLMAMVEADEAGEK